MTIEWTGIRIPEPCCCCMAKAYSTRRTTAGWEGSSGGEAPSWYFPYCRRCFWHTIRWDFSWVGGVAFGLVSFVLLMVRFHEAIRRDDHMMLLCFAGGAPPGLLFWYLLKPRIAQGCSAVTHGVYAYTSSYRWEGYKFVFTNLEYRRLFVEANK